MIRFVIDFIVLVVIMMVALAMTGGEIVTAALASVLIFIGYLWLTQTSDQ